MFPLPASFTTDDSGKVVSRTSLSAGLGRPAVLGFALVVALGGFIPRRASAQLPPIELNALSRTAGQIGSEFELQLLAGNRLEEVAALRFSDPAVSAEMLTKPPLPRTDSPLPDYGHFRVKIPAGVSSGRIEVRAVGRHGISNPRILRLTERPCSVVESASHDRQKPSVCPQGHLLLARCTPAEIDYYSVPVDEGKRLRIRFAAQAVDSRMIGQMMLLDSKGNVVQASRGTDGVDPEMVLAAAQGGEYVLAVHDFLYRGGNEYPYQLAIEAIAEDADPAERNRNEGRELLERSLHSRSERAAGKLPVQSDLHSFGLHAIEDASLETHWLPGGASETPAGFSVQPPCRIAGRFEAHRGTGRELHAIPFDADKGQRWALEIFSQRLGQPTDVRLTIERLESEGENNPQWRPVDIVDDSQAVGDGAVSVRTTDPRVLFQAPEAGRYRAVVRDLDTGDALASRQYFLLEIRQPNPGFELLAYPPIAHKDLGQSKPNGVNLVRGGAESFRVFAIRRDGWTGAIELTLEGLPEGLSCAPVSIPANQNHIALNVLAGPEAASWTGAVRLFGRANVADQERNIEAVPATVQWGKSGSRPFVRSRLATELTLAVSAQDVCPVSVQWGDDKLPEAAPGSTLKIPVRLTRGDGGKGACILRPQDLPPGVSAGEVTIPADQTEGTIELKIGGNAVPATYTPWLQVETPVKWQANPQRLQRAEAYLASLQKELPGAGADEERVAIEAAIKVAEERIEAAKASAKPQDITLYLPSNNAPFRVISP